MANKPFLKYGSRGPEVARLVELLTSHGCAPRPPVTSSNPRFGRAIENMVLYFQMTHQGKDGKWLDVDGQVGKNTWWALEHARGTPQRSFLEAGIPKGISGIRKALLETAVKEHGVREDRWRPNRGKDVDKYQPSDVTSDPTCDGRPWCAYFVSWVVKEVYGKHLLGRPVASVWTAYQRARQHGRWLSKRSLPAPGDAFVMLYGDDYQTEWCTGHIGLVLQVAKDGKSINTIEGNCGDRVKIGLRWLSDPKVKGFINIVGDRPSFERGSLRGAKNVGSKGTR